MAARLANEKQPFRCSRETAEQRSIPLQCEKLQCEKTVSKCGFGDMVIIEMPFLLVSKLCHDAQAPACRLPGFRWFAQHGQSWFGRNNDHYPITS
jgi:hypothetical protein